MTSFDDLTDEQLDSKLDEEGISTHGERSQRISRLVKKERHGELANVLQTMVGLSSEFEECLEEENAAKKHLADLGGVDTGVESSQPSSLSLSLKAIENEHQGDQKQIDSIRSDAVEKAEATYNATVKQAERMVEQARDTRDAATCNATVKQAERMVEQAEGKRDAEVARADRIRIKATQERGVARLRAVRKAFAEGEEIKAREEKEKKDIRALRTNALTDELEVYRNKAGMEEQWEYLTSLLQEYGDTTGMPTLGHLHQLDLQALNDLKTKILSGQRIESPDADRQTENAGGLTEGVKLTIPDSISFQGKDYRIYEKDDFPKARRFYRGEIIDIKSSRNSWQVLPYIYPVQDLIRQTNPAPHVITIPNAVHGRADVVYTKRDHGPFKTYHTNQEQIADDAVMELMLL